MNRSRPANTTPPHTITTRPWDILTAIRKYRDAGIGGISIPCGFTRDGLPIGLHLQAPPFEEERLLRGAHMYQQATDWHTRKPKLR